MIWPTLKTIANLIMVHTRFCTDIYIFSSCMWLITYFRFYQSSTFKTRMVNLLSHINCELVQKLQNRILVLYFSMCCMKSNCACWQKGVKHASSITKRFLGYHCCNSTTPKRIPHLRTYYTENIFFTWRFIWKNIF